MNIRFIVANGKRVHTGSAKSGDELETFSRFCDKQELEDAKTAMVQKSTGKQIP